MAEGDGLWKRRDAGPGRGMAEVGACRDPAARKT
jgi:hypothetical protein